MKKSKRAAGSRGCSCEDRVRGRRRDRQRHIIGRHRGKPRPAIMDQFTRRPIASACSATASPAPTLPHVQCGGLRARRSPISVPTMIRC
jgi:hypothetical protein